MALGYDSVPILPESGAGWGGATGVREGGTPAPPPGGGDGCVGVEGGEGSAFFFFHRNRPAQLGMTIHVDLALLLTILSLQRRCIGRYALPLYNPFLTPLPYISSTTREIRGKETSPHAIGC